MSQSDRVRSFTEVKLPVSWRRANMPLFCFLDTNMIWVHLLFKSINSDGFKKKKKDPKRFGIVSKTVGLKLKEKIHLRNTSLLFDSFYFMICWVFFPSFWWKPSSSVPTRCPTFPRMPFNTPQKMLGVIVKVRDPGNGLCGRASSTPSSFKTAVQLNENLNIFRKGGFIAGRLVSSVNSVWIQTRRSC